MFGADLTSHAFWNQEAGHSEDVNIKDSMDYLFPTFAYQKPWTRLPGEQGSSSTGDFILIAEFSEQEGPRPVITIPKDGGQTFDQNDFCLKILAVDHQSSIIEGCHMTEDAQVVMADADKGVHAFVHHTVLNDIQARGYVRPFCISYVMSDPRKLMACYQDISNQMKKVSRLLKYGNRLVFMRDLEKHLEDLDYTKANLLIQSRTSTATQGDNDLLNALNTIRKSMEEVKDIISNLKPLLDDKELEEKFQLWESNPRSTHHDSRSSDTSSLKDFNTEHGRMAFERSGSYTESLSPEFSLFGKTKDLKPKLLDVSGIRGKRRFDRSLRGLHELCSWGAREGLQRLRILREFFKRDFSALQMDEMDVLKPDWGVLSFGNDCIGANFLSTKSSDPHRCCRRRKHSHDHREHLPSLGSLESFKSLSSSFQSFLEEEEDAMYSANSSIIDSACTFDRRLSASEGYAGTVALEAEPEDHCGIFTYDTAFPGDGAKEFGNTVADTLSSRSTETITSSSNHAESRDVGQGDTTMSHVDTGQGSCANCDSNETTDLKDCSFTTDVSEYDNIEIDRDLKCTAKGCMHQASAVLVGQKHNRSPLKQTFEKLNNLNFKINDMPINSIRLPSTLNAEYIKNSIKCRRVDSPDSLLAESNEHCDNMHMLDNNLEFENTQDLAKHKDLYDVTSTCDNSMAHCEVGLPEECSTCIASRVVNICNNTLCVNNTNGASRQTKPNHLDRPCDSDVTDTCKQHIHLNLPCDSDLADIQTNKPNQIFVPCDSDRTDVPSLADNITAEMNNLNINDEQLNNPKNLTMTQSQRSENLKLKYIPAMFGKTIYDDQISVFSDCRQSSTNSLEDEHREVNCRRKWRLKHILKEPSDNLHTEASLLKVLGSYNNIQHIVYSLLSGRPVVVIGTRKHEVMIREIVQALSVFVPFLKGCEPISFLCPLKQMKVVDIRKIQLCGVIRSERRPLDYFVPHSIRRYITLFDVEKLLLHCQPYQGSLLSFIIAVYYKRKVFKSEQALVSYIQMCLMGISTDAFNFYHSVMMDNNLSFCGASVIRKSAMLELTADKFLNKAGLLNSDCRIIKHLAEIVKVQQIEQEFTKGPMDCPAYPFSVSYQTTQTYRC